MKVINEVDVARLTQLLTDGDVERLRRLWTEGLASGPSAAFDIDEIKCKARARLDGNAGPEQCR